MVADSLAVACFDKTAFACSLGGLDYFHMSKWRASQAEETTEFGNYKKDQIAERQWAGGAAGHELREESQGQHIQAVLGLSALTPSKREQLQVLSRCVT